MYLYEEVYERGLAPLARPLTYSEALAQARSEMCALYGYWCTASDQEIVQQICKLDCTIFPEPSAVRYALCGTYQCPAPDVPPPNGNGPAPEGDNTTMILALAGLAVVGAVALSVATRGKKTVLIARSP